jgi:hypothetical protein
MTNREVKSSPPAGESSTSRWKAVELVAGIVVWAAIGGIFLTDRFPAARPLVTWTLRAYAAAFVAMIVLVVVFSVVSGAAETVRLYRRAMAAMRAGPLVRVAWALVFGLGFLIAAVMARY